MNLRRLPLVLLVGTPAEGASVRGKVTNVRGGEPLGRVRVSILVPRSETITANDGTFSLPDLPPGSYTLRLDAVG